MSGSRGKRPPLVAEKRYPSSDAKPKKTKKPAVKKPAATRRKQTRKPARSGNLFVRIVTGGTGLVFRILWAIGWRATVIGAVVTVSATIYFYSQLPALNTLLDGRAKGSVTLLDNEGQVFAWRGETFGGQTSVENVSPHLRNAVIATEDKRFYRHLGISPRGIASAVRINLREGRGPLSGNGGSTITQQVAKLLCLGVPYDPTVWKDEGEYEQDCRRSSIWRKIKEVPFSLAMEAKYGKDNILTVYMNRAYLGAGARGFEAAAQRYFNKSANNVTPAEAAMLAGLLKAPSKTAPTNSLSRAQNRGAVVLGLMHDQGYLTDAEFSQAKGNPAQLSEAAAARAGGYFADWVMESGPAFLTNDTTEDVIIRTTLDQRLQTAAEEALTHIFETKVKEGSKAQAAIVVMSADGAVRAMVGGRKIKVSGAFNRATHASRPTGSTFKPFVYAAALELGYRMDDLVEDAPLCLPVAGQKDWCPKNYGRNYRGIVTLTEALQHSINTAAVRVSEAVGRDAVQQIASDFGLESDLAQGAAVALGVSDATLIEMTGAYAGILNGGSSVKPYGLIELRIQGDEEILIDQNGGMGERVVSEQAAGQLVYMMSQVIDAGTGGRARLSDRDVAGKTGTTQESRDAWFIGFTADYVAGVWMGYDDNSPLTGVTGGGLPAEIWRETMVRVHEDLPAKPLKMITPEQLPREAYQDYTAQPYYNDQPVDPSANTQPGWDAPPAYGPNDEVPDDYIAPQNDARFDLPQRSQTDFVDQVVIDVIGNIIEGGN